MRKGIIALPTIILIGGIVLEIALTLSLVSYFLLQSSAGSRFAAEALNIAQAGVNDAVMKIIRNINLGNPLYQYTMTLDPIREADLTICKDFKIANGVCDVTQPNDGETEIISVGKSFNKMKKLQAFISINSANGEVKIKSIQEISL